MRILSVPLRLRYAVGLLAVCPLFAGLQVALATDSLWWKLPLRTMGIISFTTFLAISCLAWMISYGKPWAVALTLSFGALWTLFSYVFTFVAGNAAFGFATLGLTGFWVGEAVLLLRETRRSYFDPGIRWYQGAPPAIAGLRCRLGSDVPHEVGVSRMDRDGAFMVNDRGGILKLRPDQEVEMMFTYKDRSLRCRGYAVKALEGVEGDVQGAGFIFDARSADGRKDLGDFVELLRGEGHA